MPRLAESCLSISSGQGPETENEATELDVLKFKRLKR